MAFYQWRKDQVHESERERQRRLWEKAQSAREENKDIPHLIEICIYFGIERETLKEELKKLLSD